MQNPTERTEKQRHETQLERLDRNLEEMTGELRVVVTGVQVLFAFLLIVPFNTGFAHVGSFERTVYFVTLLLAALAAVCTIAPSAEHRFLFRQHDKRHIVYSSNRIVIAGLAFLALSMCGCLLLVTTKLFGQLTGVITASVGALPFLLFWFGLPLLRRARRLGPLWTRLSPGSEDREQVADLLVARQRIGQRTLGVDQVGVSPPRSLARDVTLVCELRDDAVRCPFGDPHTLTDVTQANAGLIGDADQDLAVVGEERPATARRVGHERKITNTGYSFHVMLISNDGPRVTEAGHVIDLEHGASEASTRGSRSHGGPGRTVGAPAHSGGRVIERAVILAEGDRSAAILSWISEHGGIAEASAKSTRTQGLHGERAGAAGDGGPPRRFLLPASAFPAPTTS